MVDTQEVAASSAPAGSPADRQEQAKPKSTRHISWDAIRVLGIVAVLAFHVTFLAPLTLPGLELPPGPLQMDFPFGASILIVISGYFAAMTIGKSTPLRWWFRRLARLLPAFWVAVVFIFGITLLFAPEGLPRPSYGDLVGNLGLVHTLLADVQYIDLSHWTVPVQVAGFTAIGLLAWKAKVRGTAASVVLWLVLLVPLAARYLFMGPGQAPPQWLSMALDGTGLNRAHLLVAGVAIFRWSKGRMSFTQLYLMLGVVLIAHDKHPPGGDSVLAFAVTLVLICVAAYQPVWELPVLQKLARPIQWLAGISYGVYLMHYVVGTVVARRLADLGVPWWGWMPAFAATAVFLGWVLTRCVEQPVFKLLTRRLDTKPVVPATRPRTEARQEKKA
ncbi:Peptidoglycan/LPS O-acetylase OafA/YrhL, contains acyltransferase and SGNH-hydrolase domains [Prauserella marina]|uniref:Peptidoglycan/LPS O-acetylase OafA/YrhL, contains acyltransferase and SGNH-hydrolase domains n=1 Tax=Prauserella marina TaxID=530584 RepID=A0A1G6V665_9PSEU|nr:peptidoglycan/LPS O-acetylase OafA/YrhL [Prauserella marina]SDD49139.1 Peptidoglycan/LPS O-acetylase OafA/YrhL, contains acyltransferase and SGNH-hydrolase domains [Prauserella marina]